MTFLMEASNTNPPTSTGSPSANDEVKKYCIDQRAALANDEVKKYCIDQRAALVGEPRCVVCGRFGEYVCDASDDDICSLECKHAVLSSKIGEAGRYGLCDDSCIGVDDECVYVKVDGCWGYDERAQVVRKKLDIDVKGEFVPPPILSFSSCQAIPQKLLHNIQTASYHVPTPVQMQAIPAALGPTSLLVSAHTGSGKTASFLVPVISRCASFRLHHPSPLNNHNPLAIVLTPTRELCIQVEDQAKLLAKGLPFKTALVVGGDAMPPQLHRIKQGVEMIVATPGRLIDLLHKNEIALDDVMMFVLDEFDCMLQRGFQEQVMQIFRALSNPQVLLYSATTSPVVEKIARSMTKNITFISIGQPNQPNKAVKQIAIWVDTKHKKQKLFDILTSKQHFMPPAVVYVNSRFGADLLSNAITATTGLKALSIHGEKSMKERREIMESFLVGEAPVMVATGVLGRGIDLLKVRQVMVFDMPNSIKEYVHQIGRASRMGDEGKAFVFVNEENKNLFPELVEVLKSAGALIPHELVNSQYAMRSSSVAKAGQRKRKYGS